MPTKVSQRAYNERTELAERERSKRSGERPGGFILNLVGRGSGKGGVTPFPDNNKKLALYILVI